MHLLTFAALHWDPQIRGFLIFATAVVLLPGSVYLLLATNNGAKIGFVLAVAGLSGWILMLSLIWAVYGSNPTTGLQGGQAGWVVREVVTGDLVAHSSVPAVAGSFPNDIAATAALAAGKKVNGWRLVSAGQPGLADAQASADRYLTPPAVPTTAAPKFPPPFKTSQDYVVIGGYAKQSKDYLFRIGRFRVTFAIRHHQFYIKHPPYYFVIRVQPALPSVTLAGAAPTLPAADVAKPVTSVVMLRDVGSRRQPALMIALAAFLVFAVCTSYLHRRDKEIMRRKAMTPATA